MLIYMGKLMGIDYGARRVGVALSDGGKTFAFPHTILRNDDVLMDAISEIAQEQGVERIVVGESDNPAGGVNTIMHRIVIFSEAIEARTDLPVHQMTEVYTSAEARRAIEERVETRKDKKVPVDSAAAAIILQRYLDEKYPHLSDTH